MTVMSDDDLTDKLIHELTEKNKVKAIKDYNLKDKKGLFETAALGYKNCIIFVDVFMNPMHGENIHLKR